MIPIEIEILIGLATGLVVGITGASGVLLVVPLLTILLNFSMHTAVGTSLFVDVITPLVVAYSYYRHGNVNLKSAFNFIHACTPIMMRQKTGSIINMASVVGVSGNAGQSNYSASKAGMIGLAKSVAKELGSRGVRANAIAPGFIITEMTAVLSEEVKAEWAKQIPLRRGGTPEDVANVATFLASDLSSYVTGQVIHCCGGMNM